MAGFQTSNRAFEGVMYLIVVVAGALFMINGKISPADLTAYLLYVSTLLATLRTIIQFTEQFQRGMTGIERFLEIMDAPAEITEKENADELKNVQGNITFENVGFHYSDDDTNVLSNINLNIKKGDSVALVGPSGGGKTTLCNLIPRFYDVTEGRILIDGKDIKNVTLNSLRNSIGVVQQDVYLFSGTVFENIAYGLSGATREDVINSAKLAGAHEFISNLENGYDMQTIKKYSQKEISLFYITLFICVSLYILTLTISLIIKCVLSTNALFICFVYIIPMLMMYLIARYKEGRSVVIWKQL